MVRVDFKLYDAGVVVVQGQYLVVLVDSDVVRTVVQAQEGGYLDVVTVIVVVVVAHVLACKGVDDVVEVVGDFKHISPP